MLRVARVVHLGGAPDTSLGIGGISGSGGSSSGYIGACDSNDLAMSGSRDKSKLKAPNMDHTGSPPHEHPINRIDVFMDDVNFLPLSNTNISKESCLFGFCALRGLPFPRIHANSHTNFGKQWSKDIVNES
ncbi:hypothetical protein HAX54_023050 [Datura stramonium]|uniref:Uncharacterized protein n=1 Tax=Datura stramonium TaxID=4076 RepID=A0ABS8S4Q2_DATST|nr:hypothetical protein [Datura stramonium]